ncbi:MAG: hypothetical protein UT41_C0002G0071 [Candidatus Wolfebacteria bacterium GW2011_GWC2_39_22]|uniref:Uncharacterized protein n=1 Tax=Candidatus Wolfebacteria bacterium GW2011_GWC2_39_22 TaxID=1619013 RepID=A0A0G0RF62_9BACT|nr:MAG: hypothetical protein UT41_C0002G0071 [Candidatus Wolfebacteria bacterium GW2011_GWC2_39_22]HBI25928.1 hypothetical protein [Candidatus Wolfebacteria bacterium]
MAQHVTSEQYFDLDGQLLEIKRQIRQASGYPFDPVKLKTFLQKVIEGKFDDDDVRVSEKFALLADLGFITVPDDYVCNTVFNHVDFSNPSVILRPGDNFAVRVYKILYETVTSEECLKFLEGRDEGNIFLGMQGISVIREKKDLKLPKGSSCVAFDRKENLPFVKGSHYVPAVRVERDGSYYRHLGSFERRWIGRCDVLLGFSSPKPIRIF